MPACTLFVWPTSPLSWARSPCPTGMHTPTRWRRSASSPSPGDSRHWSARRWAWPGGPAPATPSRRSSLNLLGGLFTAFGLLATTGVLNALFSEGPTPDRVIAALPSLALVATAAALRTVVQAGAGWAQSRLDPQVSRQAEERLYDLTSRVESGRLRRPGRSTTRSNEPGRAAWPRSDSVVGHGHQRADRPPSASRPRPACSACSTRSCCRCCCWRCCRTPGRRSRSARMRYTTMFALVPAIRRKWIIAELLADRDPAAEVRSFTMRHFLLRMYDAAAKARAGRACSAWPGGRPSPSSSGEALGGVGSALVYVALGVLLALGAIPSPSRAPPCWPSDPARPHLANLMYATNRLYEDGLYFTDFLEFCADAERRLPDRHAGRRPRRLRADQRRGRRLHLPGLRRPRAARRVRRDQAGRGDRLRRRERLRQDHPRQDPLRPLRAGHRQRPVGRHRPARGRPRGAARGASRSSPRTTPAGR